MDTDEAAAPAPAAPVAVGAAAAAASEDAAGIEEGEAPAGPPPFSPEEIATATRVLQGMPANADFFFSAACRMLRRALDPAAQLLNSRKFGGVGPEAHAAAKRDRRAQKIELQQARQRDQAYVQKTGMRAARLAKLAVLTEQAGGAGLVPLIPDGAADDTPAGGPRLLTDGSVGDAEFSAGAGAGSSAAAVARDEDSAVAGGASAAAEAAPGSSSSDGPASSSAGAGAGAGAGTAASSAAAATASAAAAAAGTPAAAAAADDDDVGAPGAGIKLQAGARACYACKRRYTTLHRFYATFCEACAELNWRKRNQTCDLSGRVALVTGARVKIGFHVVLKLLRAGADVIATTRFPHDAAERFAALPDFPVWKGRLRIFGLDLRDLPALESFCALLNRELPRLDIIINNACQTVRRPPAFYAPLLQRELMPASALPAPLRPLIEHAHAHQAGGWSSRLVDSARGTARVLLDADAASADAASADAASADAASADAASGAGAGAGAASSGSLSSTSAGASSSAAADGGAASSAGAAAAVDASSSLEGSSSSGSSGSCSTSASSSSAASSSSSSTALTAAGAGSMPSSSAVLSQVPVVPGDDVIDMSLFPTGLVDVNGQSIDLRQKNSWTMRMHEVSTPELAEVFAINAMAPFIINARLKGLMTRGRDLPPSVARHSWRKDGQADVDALARMLPPSLREAMLGDLVSEGLRPGGALRSAAAAAGASASAGAGGAARAEDGASGSEAAAGAAGGAGGPPSKRPRREAGADASGAASSAAASDAVAAKKERAAASARRSGLAGVSKLLGDVAAAVPASLCRFVINVSAMEGKFARAKTPAHPHTNMAKAALNMQTRTAAQDYAEELIFMNAVDTGWINLEQPVELAQRKIERHAFQTPIDEIDAAARILDPIFAPLAEAQGLAPAEGAPAVDPLSAAGDSGAAAAASSAGAPKVTVTEDGMCRPCFGGFLKDYFFSEW